MQDIPYIHNIQEIPQSLSLLRCKTYNGPGRLCVGSGCNTEANHQVQFTHKYYCSDCVYNNNLNIGHCRINGTIYRRFWLRWFYRLIECDCDNYKLP